MVTIRPALLYAVERDSIALIETRESTLLETNFKNEKARLAEELEAAMLIYKGLQYPEGSFTRKMADAMLADQKKANGLSVEKKVTLNKERYEEIL